MDSSSRHTVLKLFEQTIGWMKMKRDSVKFNWTEHHLSVVHSYAVKLSLNSDFKVLSLAKLFKDENSNKYATNVAFFAQELQEFFVVPKQYQLFERDDTLKQNELVAAFINMLLILLHRREGSIDSVEDRIDILEKELRFLLSVLGDTSLMCDEHEQKQNLLSEIEAVANEAGSLVHSVVFSTFGDSILKTMDERFGVLLKHMEFLKANIIEFSNLQPFIAETDATPKMAAVDSLFIINSLLYDIEDLFNRENDMIVDVKDQIKELQQELKFSQSFIKDIRASRDSEMEELNEPVLRIRDVAYEAEYLINSFLVGDAPLWYVLVRLSHVIHKIKIIETEIQETKKNYDVESASKLAKNISANLSLQNKRSSQVDDIIVGFEENAMDILNHLDGGEQHLQIICIFGMPGLGKTTLAKKLYNHTFVKYKFDKCSWCIVSQSYHRKNLLIDILVGIERKLDRDTIQNMEEESLVEHIYKSLKRRRYLIVMDDIWSSNAWYDLRSCFPDDRNGSRILFTSRNKDVAPPDSINYELPCISDEQCWELLEKKVFQNEPCPPTLVKTGKKIATSCRGLPLAVVVIAGILSSMDRDENTWKNVGGNLASYIFSDQNNLMMQILELSYKHLPDRLKPCFLYFGSFPEDREIPLEKLKCLWMAEGFIHAEENKSAEDIAEEYVMELINKSLLTVAKRRADDGIKTCVIHDLLRDLCLKRSKQDNFLKLIGKNCSMYEKHQRLFVRVSDHQISSPFGLHVRSLFGSLGNSALDILNMKLLRVLDLLETLGYIDNLNEIKFLVHLRYLAINYEPSSMSSLTLIISIVNLEFLVVGTADAYVHIPSSIVLKMMKLRCIKFTKVVCFDQDCNTSQINNIESLSNVYIRNINDEEMLKRSPHLRTLKCNCAALWVEEEEMHRYLDFSFFSQLESLNVVHDLKTRILHISLPLNIKKLSLCSLGLPWEKMSIIGRLPKLEVLKLQFHAFVGEIWEVNDEEFQQLTFLKMEWIYFHQWKMSDECSQYFPKLRQLVLDGCRNLQEIPSEIGEIATLQLIEVKGWCQLSLVESAQQIEQEQQDMGNEELKVIIKDIIEAED